MEFDDYQRRSRETAVYPGLGSGKLEYPALGLAGEAGEVCEKVKKILRGDALEQDLSKEALSLELGDVLWYLAAMCWELNISLDDVARRNLEKLQGRRSRGTIKGSGDLR